MHILRNTSVEKYALHVMFQNDHMYIGAGAGGGVEQGACPPPNKFVMACDPAIGLPMTPYWQPSDASL